MTIKTALTTVHLCWFSQPRAERILYRQIKKHRIHSIVELGIRDLGRSKRLIRMARQFSTEQRVRLTAIDLFDARPTDRPRLTLKATHRVLSASEAAVRLLPGDPASVLSRYANQLTGTQLLIISGFAAADDLGVAWYYVPRMLAAPGQVFWQSSAEAATTSECRPVRPEDMDRWAQMALRANRAAA